MADPTSQTIEVEGRRLDTSTWGSGTPGIVLLHDGLGSVEQWRSVPADLCAMTGTSVLAYDRAGHGRSSPVPEGSWPADWLHREAEVLAALIDAIGAADPVLVGHSDGGSIAAIHAAESRSTSPMVLLAAHSWVEAEAAEEIGRMRIDREAIIPKLGRFHAHPDELFEAWSGVWTSQAFATWDIRPMLGRVVAPTLVLQGHDDEFATSDQAMATAAAIGGNATCRLIEGAGHLMHHTDTDTVVDAIVGFIGEQTA